MSLKRRTSYSTSRAMVPTPTCAATRFPPFRARTIRGPRSFYWRSSTNEAVTHGLNAFRGPWYRRDIQRADAGQSDRVVPGSLDSIQLQSSTRSLRRWPHLHLDGTRKFLRVLLEFFYRAVSIRTGAGGARSG